MTEQDAASSVRRLYWLTGSFALAGFVCAWVLTDARNALGYLLGALGSLGNLWVYERLTRSIAPGEDAKKPMQAGAFVLRYVFLLAGGYVIVKGLGVNPLEVILGLLASTAAVLSSSLFELLQSFFVRRNSHP